MSNLQILFSRGKKACIWRIEKKLRPLHSEKTVTKDYNRLFVKL